MPTITLANASFTIDNTTEDQIRRDGYFRNPSNPNFFLTEEEQGVLDVLGIDKVMQNSMRPYLSKFFTALPSCQTDTQMILSKSCEIPYYVIWSTQFAARQGASDQFDTNKKNTVARTDIEMAENGVLIDDLKPVPEITDVVRQIFTLMPLTSFKTAPAKRNVTPSATDTQTTSIPSQPKRVSMIDRIFTLMYV